jgi:hypothetical protein
MGIPTAIGLQGSLDPKKTLQNSTRRLSERTTESMDGIADHCGFRSAEVLYRLSTGSFG